MATNNAINTTSGKIRLEKAASDLQTTYVGANSWSYGLDATDSSFRLSANAILGTNDTFKMTTAGERTMPLQPVFLATGTTESNITGDNTTAYLGATAAFTVITNQGTHFNVGGGGNPAIFTAPATGTYTFVGNFQPQVPVAGGDKFWLGISTSNRDYYTTNVPTRNRLANFMGVNDRLMFSGVVVADMDVGDIARYFFRSNGGAKTTDNIGQKYGGFLVC